MFKELKAEKIDELYAYELYKNKPITNYLQHGDKIIEPDVEYTVDFDELTNSFKDRLWGIRYELIELQLGQHEWERGRVLYMTNASIQSEVHFEAVHWDCDTVFEAVCWRNEKNSLPMMLT